MGKTSQRKGRGGELELSRILNDAGISCRPGAAVSYGCTPDLLDVPGIHPEVKRVEKLNVHTAMNQAVRDADKFKDGLPAVFHRRNRTGWLVTMTLTDWIRMYKESRQ